MKIKYLLISFFLFVVSFNVFADGLLMPNDTTFPGYFLRNRVTEVSVTIHGLVAETRVCMEFVNDWNKTVDGVFSFPLPPEARATKLLYTRNDTLYQAILKVMPQSPNPGTGGGGIVALVNKYLGVNALKMELKGIAPNAIQKVELYYISLLDYHKGKFKYTYPLNTMDFITNPIDHLDFVVDVQSNSTITGFDIPSHPSYQTLINENNHLVLRMRQPHAYLAKDITFSYEVDNTTLTVDAYSIKSDTMNSHFALFVRPENTAVTPVFQKNIVFLLGTASTMLGYRLQQSVAAISQCLDLLTSSDYFNIIIFNSSTSNWKPYPVAASPANIAAAKVYLNGLVASGGSRLDLGINASLGQFQSNQNSNSIIAFTDGRSPLDPRQIKTNNVYKTGIFPVAIGSEIDRARLEMLAILNYGFITYLKENDNISEGIMQVFEKVSKPIFKSTTVAFEKPDVTSIIPAQFPSVFAGSFFSLTGRYIVPGTSNVTVSGIGVEDTAHFNFSINFSESTYDPLFPQYIWAKEIMDALERDIAVYGETQAKKDSLIYFSLRYGMRCRYTAYFADYTNVYVAVELMSFNATVIGEDVLLQWSTTSELNTKGYEVEVSADGINFHSVAFIQCSNSGNQINNYSYIIKDAVPGSYYRIKQVDFDGSVRYTNVIKTADAGPMDYSLSQNYPNPFNPSTKIVYTIPREGSVKLTLYNIAGQKVRELVNSVKPAGKHQLTFNAGSFGSGVYFYNLTVLSDNGNIDFNQTKKLIILK